MTMHRAVIGEAGMARPPEGTSKRNAANVDFRVPVPA